MKTLYLAAFTVLLLAGSARANGPGFPGVSPGYVNPGVGFGGGYGGGYNPGFGGGYGPGYGGYGGNYVNPGFGGGYGGTYVNPGFGGGYGGGYANPYGGLNPGYGRVMPHEGYGGLGNYNSFGGYYPNLQVMGAPSLIGGNYYGLTYGGGLNNYYRSPSGYYYPWVGGTAYSSYPIFYSQTVSASPVAQLPPLSTMFSDLNDYLDQERKDNKLSDTDYEHLKRRSSDLLAKEKSIAYETGGMDTTQETDLRRDIEQLSAEVAQRVKR